MSDVRDAALLFKNDDWHGGALYLNGAQTVTDLGSAKAGGRFGFGNVVRSIRVTPFFVNLNVSIVTSGDDLPGIWPTTWWAEGVVKDVVERANAYLLAQNALLQMEIARITFRDDPKQFNISGTEGWAFPSAWKNRGELDVIVVNHFAKEGKAGRTPRPCFGQALVMAAKVTIDGVDTVLTNELLAITLVHELGHYLGLSHGTANKDSNNIMFPDGSTTDVLSGKSLWKDQIREMQDRLANNLARKSDRKE
ncbi:MAG: hypothetical protein ICV60_14500 [Pyrinomonadaceae bacterium]|nr:hypothetical protein [Pyrinomonadaceae bacterium]